MIGTHQRLPDSEERTLWRAWILLLGATIFLATQGPLPAADDPAADQESQLANAKKLNDQATELYQRGQYEKATELLQRALRIVEKAYPRDKHPNGHADLAETLGNLGALYRVQAEFSKARIHYERALAMYETLYPGKEGHEDLATTIGNLGMLFHDQGEYGKALELYERALTMRMAQYPKSKFPQGHPLLANSFNSLGGLYSRQGEYAKAIEYYERALAMRRDLYPKDKFPDGHPELAISLTNLGGPYRHRGEHDKSLPYLTESLAMCEGLFPAKKAPRGHPLLAACLTNIGALHRAKAEYALAEPHDKRALAMYEQLYPEARFPNGHPHLADSIANLGELFHEQGELGKVLPYYERALAMREKLYPAGHPHLAGSLHSLAAVFEAQGDDKKALAYYDRSLAMRHGLTDAFLATASEAEGLDFLAHLPLTRDAYLSIARRLPDTAEASYAHVWRGKAALAKLVERRQQALLLADPTTQKLGQELTETRQDLAAILLARAGTLKDQAKRVRELTERKEALERKIARSMPAFAQLQERDRLTPQDLADKLPAGSAFVDLLRYVRIDRDPKMPGRKGEKRTVCYVAFVLSPGQPVRRVDLEDAAPIDKALAGWRQDLALAKLGAREPMEHPSALRQRLWQPIAKHIPAGTKAVFLAPDASLTGLPWAALPGNKDGSVLLEEHAVAVVPHGRLLLEQLLATPAVAPRDGVLLAVGGVQYDKEPAAVGPKRDDLALRAPGDGNKLSWPELKGAKAELEQVSILAGKRETLIRQGDQASTAQLLIDLPKAKWAHLATHGFFADPKFRSVLQVDEELFASSLSRSGEIRERTGSGARNPLVLSGLVLAGANRDQKDRGIVTAEAIAGLPLHNLDLAVLSACETGLGEVAGGEGVFGLQRAFHVAGARTVVATLWKVDDKATAALMSLFYHHLWREQKEPLEALRAAQLEIYKNPQLIPKLAELRGPDLTNRLPLPVEGAGGKPGERAPAKLWAAFTLSGLGR